MKLLRFLLSVLLMTLATVFCYGQCQWDRFKKATDEATAEGKALTEAIDSDPSIIDDWEKLDKAGIRDIQVGYRKAANKEKWLSDLKVGVYRNGNTVEYVNPSNHVLTWGHQHPNSIPQAIESARTNTKVAGKPYEGKVGKFLSEQGKEIEGFGLGIENTTLKKTAGDIDVMTKNELIEVKKGYTSFKDGQLEKFVDPSLPNYLNPHGKKSDFIY